MAMKPVAVTEVKKGKLKPHDALALLAADHEAVAALFRDYERSRKSATRVDKGKRALRICHQLAIHAAIEEEIFYPAAAAVLGRNGQDLLAEARIEHGIVEQLVARLENMSASDPAFDATVRVLAATVRHHVDREESELFPLLRHSKLDLAGTGEKLASRQLELATTPVDRRMFTEGRKVMGG
jgi:hemerythrin superfamily protein